MPGKYDEFFKEVRKDLMGLKEGQAGTDLQGTMSAKIGSTIKTIEKATDENWQKEYGEDFTIKPAAVMRRLIALREDAQEMPSHFGKAKLMEVTEKYITDPKNYELVKEAKQMTKESEEKNAELKKRAEEINYTSIRHTDEIGDLCSKKYPNFSSGSSRYYNHTLGGLQFLTKHTDEEIADQVHGILNKENSLEAKQLKAKTLENVFQKVLEFDESKAEYNSFKELWFDNKYKDFQIAAGAIWDSDTTLTDYAKLINDPEVDTKLDENMFKEVESKMKVFNGSAGFTLSQGTVKDALTGPYAADYDIDKIMQHSQDKIINAAAKTADPVLMGLCTIKQSATEGIGLCPGQKFGDAVELNRKQRGLEPFKSDEERKERYNEISNALKNDSPEAAEERMKEKKARIEYKEAVRKMAEEAQTKLDELDSRPKGSKDSGTFTNMRNALKAIADFSKELKAGNKIDNLKVDEALDNLKTTSEEYTKSHTGWRHPFSGNTDFGKDRIRKSRDFASFAVQQKEALAEKAQPVKAENQPVKAENVDLLAEKVIEAQRNIERTVLGLKDGVPGNYALRNEYATIATAAHIRSLQKKNPALKANEETFTNNYNTMIGDKSFNYMIDHSSPDTLYKAATQGNGGLLYEELKNAQKARKAEDNKKNEINQPVVNKVVDKEKKLEAKK